MGYYADALTELDQQEQAAKIRNNLQFSLDANPQKEGEYRRLFDATGVPIQAIRDNEQEVRTTATLRRFDAEGLVRSSPATAQLLTDQDNAKLMHRDITAMAAVEQQAKQPVSDPEQMLVHGLVGFSNWLSESGQALLAGAASWAHKAAGQFNLALGGLPVLYGKATGDTKPQDWWFKNMVLAEDSAQKANELGAQASFNQKLMHSIGSLGPMMGAVMLTGGGAAETQGASAVSVLGGAVRNAIQSMWMPAATDAIDTGRKVFEQTGDASKALLAAQAQYVATTGFGMVPLSAPGGLLQRATTGFAAALPYSEVSRKGMNAVLPSEMQTPFSWEDMAITGMTSSLMGAVMGPRRAMQTDAVRATYLDAAKADAATEDMNKLGALSQLSASVGWREHDPAAFKAFIESAKDSDTAPQEVYIDARALMGAFNQSGVKMEQVKGLMPKVAQEMAEGVATGGMVRIPIEDFMTHIAGSEVEKAILPEVKTDPDGMTYQDAQVFMQGQVEQFKVAAEKAAAERAVDQSWQESRQQVLDDVTRQLGATGRFPSFVDSAYAEMQAAFWETQAARHGVTPAEAYEKFGGAKIVAEDMGGQRFDQNTAQIDTPEFKNWFGDSKVVDVEGKPLVVYHGTNADFQVFEDRARETSRAAPSELGTWATASSDYAAIHGDAVMPLFITLKNPKEYTEAVFLKLVDSGADFAALRQQLESDGYDGVVVKGAKQKLGKFDVESPSNFVSFRPEQIKSAIGNRGTFDPNDPNILHQQTRGAFNPATNTISLLKAADLSTFLHESGHFYLDTYSRMAVMGDAPEGVRQDFQKLLDWFGVKDAAEWHNLGMEEQRSYHEQFARGFEAYLMEGKAPSVEMASVFQRFADWLKQIYRNVSALNVELTPEVRGVMDRMLATDESIRQAEAIRGMSPLFESAERAGMTPEQWAEYQLLGSEATRAAQEALQTRSMRDMRWLRGAKSDAIKALQREEKSKRAEMTIEARREIMQQPVYQAWQFLKARENLEPVPAAEQGNGLDVSRDSLIVAVAKLGGLDRDQLIKEWGLDPAEQGKVEEAGTKRGLFGERGKFGRVVKKGRSLDEMGMALAERGYLDTDANGRYDMREFEDKFFGELYAGEKEYSHQADWDAIRNGPSSAEQVKALAERNGGRLDADKIGGIPGGEKVAALRMARKGGLDPDIVAERFGFEDGRDLVNALANAEPPKLAIEGLTDKLMLEKYGDLSSPEAIDRAAEKAIHNEARARFVATELAAIKKAGGGARMMSMAAKQVAEQVIGGKPIGDIRPRQYEAAEAKAAKNAAQALAKDDLVAAASEKNAQLLNNRLARVAADALDTVRSGVDYLKKFDKASVREKIHVDYRDQIDALLDQYDLRRQGPGEVSRKQSLADFIEALADKGITPDIPERLLDQAARQHYSEMAFADFRGLLDSIKALDHLGRLKEKLLDSKEMRDLNEVADEAVETMAGLPQRAPDSNRGMSRIDTAWAKAKSAGHSAKAALLKMEQMMDWLDARNPNGVWNRVVFRRLAEAGVRENDMRAMVKTEIDKLMDAHLDDVVKDGGRIYVAEKLIDGLTGKPQRFTKKELLMLAGNMGNDSNVGKLARGEGWSEQELWKFVDASMEKADWDFINGMARVIESYWPEKLAMERRLGNTTPEKVQPRPFATRHGEMPGWYWPIIYDPARAQDVAERSAKKGDQLFENIYTRANTDTGRMNTRNANYARPMLLSLDALPKTIMDEIHDIAYREAIIDADKFISHGKVRQGVIDALGKEYYDQLRPWLQAIANDGNIGDEGSRALRWFNDVAHGARTRATMVGLGYRLTTMLVHGSSAGIESVAELGPRWMAEGLKTFANPAKWADNRDFIFERSGEMRNRMNEVDRDVREHLREIELRLMDPASSAASRAADAMKAHAYEGIAMLDMASALPTWMGAYLKALSPAGEHGLGMSEADAVAFADKTVRNAHGGTGIKDLAAVQRGPEFFKLFSMFYTFWNHNINRIMDTARLAGELPATYRAGDMAKFRGDLGMVLMRTLAYTFGVQMMHSMLHPPKENADEDSWLKWAAKEVVMAGTSGIPILRDITAHYVTGKDYQVTPAASMVESVGQSGADIWNAATDHKVSEKWLKHTITNTGYVFGLPLGQPASAVQFLWDVERGAAHPQDVADWWRGIVHGDMKKH